MHFVLFLANRKSPTDEAMTSQRSGYFRLPPFGIVAVLLLAAGSRGLVPEEGVAGDVMEEGVVGDVMGMWSISCSEAQLRCHMDITCRVLLETIDKVCDQSGMIQHLYNQ